VKQIDIGRLLIFDPFALIEEHSWSVAKLCNQLKKLGWHITLLRCDESYDFCTVMDYQGVHPEVSIDERLEVCNRCISVRQQQSKILDERIAVFNLKRRSHISNDFFLDEKTIYEPVIKFKKSNLEFDLSERPWFIEAAKAFEVSFKWLEELIPREIPDAVIIFSPQYAAGSGASEAARKLGVPTIFVEGSSSPVNRWTNLRMWDWEKYGLVNPIATSEEYLQCRLHPLSIMHFRMLRKGLTHSAYSKPATGKSIRRKLLGKYVDKELILAIVSSTDEVFSAQAIGKFTNARSSRKVYASQVEWIKDLCRFIKENDDFVLVIRIHPRDFNVSSNGKPSDASLVWLDMAKNKKVYGDRVIWDFPTDGRSLYELLACTNIVTTGWSSVALEALFLGKQVVTYDEQLSGFPFSLTKTGNSKIAYYNNLVDASRSNKSVRNMVKALKYVSYRDFDNTFKVGGMAYAHPVIMSFRLSKRLFLRAMRAIPKSRQVTINVRLNSPKPREKLTKSIMEIISSHESKAIY
jgi:hypothetical protein